MTQPAIIQGTFSDYRMVKGRKVLQIIIEVPMEGQRAVFEALGYPMPDTETWVAVARLKKPGDVKEDGPEPPKPSLELPKPKQPFAEKSAAQQAGILCNDTGFQSWVWNKQDAYDSTTETTARYVRDYCGIASRAELNANAVAENQWRELLRSYRADTGQEAEER